MTSTFERVVIGGGVFGLYSGLVLARRGYSVLILESSSELMSRASKVNQARIHTGLHYPRSLQTARESLKYYRRFREEFPTAVRDFTQVYAISKYNSLTSEIAFRKFLNHLDQPALEISVSKYFKPSAVSAAFEVEEPSFDWQNLLSSILLELSHYKNVEIRTSSKVTKIERSHSKFYVSVNGDEPCFVGHGMVFATYAQTNTLRMMASLNCLPLQYELAQILVGKVSSEYQELGFTVMDGPFWSLMPFGKRGLHSLTTVGLTPRLQNKFTPEFHCQLSHETCRPNNLEDCNSCSFRPEDQVDHFLQQFRIHFQKQDVFTLEKSYFTIKTILRNTSVDDARPTIIEKEEGENIWTVFSGKVSTIFDLEGVLV